MAAGGSPIASPSRDSEQQWCLGFFVLSLSALLEVTLQFQPAFYTNERTVRSCHIISLLLFLSTSKAVLIANWLIQAPEQPPTDPLLPETLLGLAGCLLFPPPVGLAGLLADQSSTSLHGSGFQTHVWEVVLGFKWHVSLLCFSVNL